MMSSQITDHNVEHAAIVKGKTRHCAGKNSEDASKEMDIPRISACHCGFDLEVLMDVLILSGRKKKLAKPNGVFVLVKRTYNLTKYQLEESDEKSR